LLYQIIIFCKNCFKIINLYSLITIELFMNNNGFFHCTTHTLVPVLKHIQRDISSLELYDMYPLVVDYIFVVRSTMKKAIVVHKQLYCNETVQIDNLKTVLTEYDNLIQQFKNEYYITTEPVTETRGRVPEEITSKTSKRDQNNKENTDPEDKSLIQKTKLLEKRILNLESQLQNAELRAKEAEERATKNEKMIVTLQSELKFQELLMSIYPGTFIDHNDIEELKLLEIEDKLEKLQKAIKEEKKQTKERKRKSSKSKKNVFSPLSRSQSGSDIAEVKSL